MMMQRRQALAVFGTAMLGGCNALQYVTNREPPTLFELTPKTTFDESLPRTGSAIVIDAPTATAGLNTARIALRPDATRLEYYANAIWVDVVPVMVQNLLTESLDSTDRVDALSPMEASGIRANYSLRMYIREFQAEYDEGTDKPPMVHVNTEVRLLDMPRRDSLATVSFEQFERSKGTSISEVVLAYDEALGKVLKRLVDWTIKSIITANEAGSTD
ncbi:MAG: membrane integrity-associated transporter subunit PqiC [Geminicoccaceae bacterium]|nr:membrane integrity-associated transporter subunit PqiC [Geminicoccaceae bacterium]MCB9942537.1 membrane integrity-associated transporter subunit PqiC [Geminicoccaceae bacterium]